MFINIVCLLCLLVSCHNSVKTDTEKTEADIPQQEKELKKIADAHPDSMLLKENLIQYYRDNKNYGEGIKAVDQFIKKDTSNDHLYDIKGQMYFLNHDTLNSIKAYEKAIDINPDPMYVIALGTMYAQTKNPLALEMSDALLQAPTAKAQMYAVFIKGLYYNYTGEYAKAISFFNGCNKMDYTFPDAYIEKTIALSKLGKYDDALKVTEQLISLDHSFADGYYWRGYCFEKLNKKDDAIENYKLALQLDPEYIEAKDALGKMGASIE